MAKKKEEVKKEDLKDQDPKMQEGDQQESVKEEQEQEVAEKDPQAEIDALNDKYLRLYSEFENYRKRTLKEKSELSKTAGGEIIKDVLPVLDDFERAIQANEKVEDANALKEGFQLIYNKMKSSMEAKGLKHMDSKGEVFNTDTHEAITEIPAPEESLKGKVVDVVEKGYYYHDRVIRFAKVVVGK